jgi:hypothetical protein
MHVISNKLVECLLLKTRTTFKFRLTSKGFATITTPSGKPSAETAQSSTKEMKKDDKHDQSLPKKMRIH